MYTGMLHTHKLVVFLFLLQYIIKTILLFLNKDEMLQNYARRTRVVEMLVSVLFLGTGIYLAFNSGNNGTWLWVKLIAVLLSIPVAVIAFKKRIKIMAAISILLLVYAYGVSETKSPVFKKQAGQAGEFDAVSSDVLGQAIYQKKCANCHGPDGRLGMSGAKDLTATVLPHEQMVNIISNGKNAMMGFKDQLTPDQVEAVAFYVESMK